MPNWCINNLIVSVSDVNNINLLNEFYNNNKSTDNDGSELDFNKLIPIPKALENTSKPNNSSNNELKEQYGFDNWYDWSVANWGTKWNLSDVSVQKKDNEIHYHFDTAWSPPIPWATNLIDKYPDLDLKLTYLEPSMDFGGYLEYKNKEIHTIQYVLSEYIWENLDKEHLHKIVSARLEDNSIDLNSNIDEFVELILEDLEDVTDYSYNIHEDVSKYIMEIINDDIENLNKLDYKSNGNSINKISL
jgi:hypothetical protein